MQIFTLILSVEHTILLSYNSLLLHRLFVHFSPMGAILEPSNSCFSYRLNFPAATIFCYSYVDQKEQGICAPKQTRKEPWWWETV